ncbi:hypothetical protein [Segatella baroniae]|uniref:hypothetical protein n=1 Tax=Segatella baroniae TaxID=305719 RepID=UPI0005C5D7A9|nr:hypothetical protein [Segatella baroniae]
MKKKDDGNEKHIRALPFGDFDAAFLFSELDPLGVTAILKLLSKEYDITLESDDAMAKSFLTPGVHRQEDKKPTMMIGFCQIMLSLQH